MPLAQNPERLEEMLSAMPYPEYPVIIDEIQKLPSLLDEIHYLIETKGIHFVLTGSSDRKLKSTGVNLLAGRAFEHFIAMELRAYLSYSRIKAPLY